MNNIKSDKNNDPKKDFSYKIAWLSASWFGVGKISIASGTWGSFAALPFAWIIFKYFGPIGLSIASILTLFLGIWAAEEIEKKSGKKDPSLVVIDEVVGQWMTLIFVPLGIETYIFGFILFRFADILKPWPACWADSKLHGGLGIMLDDCLAAIYSGLGVYLLHQYNLLPNLSKYLPEEILGILS